MANRVGNIVTTGDASGMSNTERLTAKRSDEIVVTDYCPETPYLQLRLPEDLKRVHRITFKLSSHDQGFSGEARSHGSYNGSSSWFEVAAITPAAHDSAPRRHLQCNVHADSNFREHVISWGDDGGSEDIKSWLKLLRAGATIQILPKARYPMWLNVVQSAEMEVVVELMPAPSLLYSLSGSVGTITSPVDEPHEVRFYQPLNGAMREIRLLHIRPGSWNDDINCSIEVVSLNDSHRATYESLSYCWGDITNTRPIGLRLLSPDDNDESTQFFIEVTENLYQALRHIRREDRTRVFWIDAICINQSDLEERSQQVATMREIYSSSTGVVIWLGLSTPAVKKCIEVAREILKMHLEMPGTDYNKAKLEKLHQPGWPGNGYFLEECELFKYDWFRRAWVVQEVFNATEVEVYTGTDIIPWSLVLRLNRCMHSTMLIPNPVRKDVMGSLLTTIFELDKEKKMAWRHRQDRLEILDVIVRGLDLDATDPRDKIFALLSFGKETADIPKLPAEIRPDYSKAPGRVFGDFTRWWISDHRSLRILSSVHLSVGRTWQNLSFNSDFPQPSRASWSIWHDGRTIWSLGTLGLSPDKPYCASGSTVPDISILDSSSSPLILRLQGRRVTSISKLAPYPYYKKHAAHKQLHDVYTEIFDPVDYQGTWNSATFQPDFLGMKRPYAAHELSSKQNDHLHGHYDYGAETGGIECHPETFFTTPEGHIGVCPAPTRINDEIVVLDGGNVPYLIRPTHGSRPVSGTTLQYELVGECYLEGYMFGRAMEDGNASPPEIYELV